MSQLYPEAVREAAGQYHRLVLLIAPSASAVQSIPPEYADCDDSKLINLNIELSKRLLDLAKKERPARVNKLVQDIVADCQEDVVILTRIELLFEPSLQVDVIQLLKSISRNRNIVAVWPGRMSSETLSYANPGHREYRIYQRTETGAVIVELEQAN